MRPWLFTVLLLGLTAVYVQMNPPANLAVGRGVLAACPRHLRRVERHRALVRGRGA
jgi:hypothetical protein